MFRHFSPMAVWLAGAAFFILPMPGLAVGRLVKIAAQSTVYYVDGENVRHPFPDALTYRSWYGNDYSRITVLAPQDVAKLPLGKNITLKPGKWLVKIPSAPTVYAVEQGGVLRALSRADVAEAIYGPRWLKKVVDIPEAFFSNYVVGQPLTRTYELPSSIVYQVEGKPTYYWKIGNLLQPFKNFDAVAANGYAKEDVVVGDRTLPTRTRTIAGSNDRLTSPLNHSLLSNQDCGSPIVRVGLILVNRGDVSDENVAALKTISDRLPEAYRWATRELGDLVVGDTVVMLDDGSLTRATEQGGRKITEEAPLTFYDQNPDAFDFLILFSNFTVQQDQPNHEARFVPVTNAISGLNLPLLNAAEMFGSRGQLKGIIIVGDIGRFELENEVGKLQLDNLLLHEIAHQWSGAVKVRLAPEQDSTVLLRDDAKHWSYYASLVSPLGGSGWEPNNDGTYTSRLSKEPDLIRRPYAELDLYLMGLLPAQVIQPVFYLEPNVANQQNNTIAGTPHTVTIEQIVAANGKRRCELR